MEEFFLWKSQALSIWKVDFSTSRISLYVKANRMTEEPCTINLTHANLT